MKDANMIALYEQYAPTRKVLQEKEGIVAPEVQKKRNQCAKGDDWFSLATKKKADKIRNTR